MLGRSLRQAVLYFHHIRTMIAGWWYLRAAELGPRVRVSGRPRVTVQGGRLRVDDRVQIYSTLARTELAVYAGGDLHIGSGTLVNFGCQIVATERIDIGPHCHIGPHCMIADNSFHCVDPERRLERPPSRPIVIEGNVWLGARVIVLPGVTIGRDAVVGAGSVVTRDVPARSLVAGVPAAVVRSL